MVEQQQQQQQQQGWTAADPYMQARMRQKISRFSDLVSTIQRSNADVYPYAARGNRRMRVTRPTDNPQDSIINNSASSVSPLTRVDRSPRTTVLREVEIVDNEGMNDMMMVGMGTGMVREGDGEGSGVVLAEDLEEDEGYYNDYSNDEDKGYVEW